MTAATTAGQRRDWQAASNGWTGRRVCKQINSAFLHQHHGPAYTLPLHQAAPSTLLRAPKLNPVRLCRPGFSYHDPARRRVIHTTDSPRSLAPAAATPPEYDVVATYPQRQPHHATVPPPPFAHSIHSDAAATAAPDALSTDELADAFFDHAPEEGTHPRSFDDTLPHPPSEDHPTYEQALKKPRRRTRILEATSPFDPPPIDGPTRFDWRDRRRPKFDTYGLPTWQKWWYPETPRVMPKMTKMNETDGGWAELRRYSDHFVPLLLAEQAEAEIQLENRLSSWSDHQLRSEGFMINGLAGSTQWQPRYKVHGSVVSFSRWGRDGTKPLPPSQFEPGATVILSRTHPCQDAYAVEGERVKGSVFTISRGVVRILLPELPKDIERGTWRIDLGVSDFAIQKQREAIDRLNLDPVLQDQQSLPAALADQAPEDEALAVTMRRQRPQEILIGTGLRDLILRRFQTHYQPLATPGAPQLDEIAAQVAEMKPEDMEAATGVEHDASSPRGILSPNRLIDSWARRYRVPEGRQPVAVEGDPHVPLNPSQTRAIAMMLSERLSLVQGPPGTGKTRVIVETIKLLKQHWQIPHPILVCAHTNVAVDNLVEGLQTQSVKAVRFGSPDRVSARVEPQTLEARIEQHPAYPVLNRARNSKETLQTELNDNLAGPVREAKQKEIGKLNGRIYLLKRRIQAEVLHDADVVCTTCLSATSRVLEVIDFPFVFLDEASMATEPLSIVPLTKGSAQVAIIGDHKQLPPVIISETAQQGGLGTSLFERLIHEKIVPSIMLDTQYRMHPAIAAFSSEAFYNGQLKDGTVSDGRVDPVLQPPTTAFLLPDGEGSKSLTFLNHDFPESPQNRSIANHHEAGRVCDIVADLLASNPDLKGSDIGVIAPYSAQIRLITEFLTIDERRQRAFRQWLGDDRAREIEDIEIRTVDGFEGREKAVILFSTVRSNTGGFLGFLGDWRRLNVGLTRAKRALIMLGSLRTLSNGVPSTTALEKKGIPIDGTRVWKRFVDWLRKNGLVMEDPA